MVNDGYLGCEMCYTSMKEIIREIYLGDGKHQTGEENSEDKAPENENGGSGGATGLDDAICLAKMQEELEALVVREEYEKAAELRDKIIALEKVNTKNENPSGCCVT